MIMNQPIIKTCLTGAILGVVTIFSQACGKADTTNQHATVIMGGLATNHPSWLVSFKQHGGTAGTNGLACDLWLENHQSKEDKEEAFCTAYISNKATNTFSDCWMIYQASYLRIILLDSEGRPVEKTEAGKQCGNLPTQQQWKEQVQNRLKKWSSGRTRTSGFRQIVPKHDHQGSVGFRISELFELKEAGKYTMQVQMPIIQRVGQEFKITWLPEVVAEIQIRSGNIPAHN